MVMRERHKLDNVRAEAKIATDTLDQMYARKIVLPVDTVKELKGKVSDMAHIDQAMERGWEPWTPPNGIVMGLVEKIANPANKLIMPLILSMVAVLVTVIGEILVRSSGWSAFTLVIPIAVGAVGLWVDGYHRKRLRELRETEFTIKKHTHDSPGYSLVTSITIGDILIYSGLIPVAFWEKYTKDKHLFDRTYIASFNKAHFTTQVVPALRTDPFLVGRIDNLFFLGGHWGMADELNEAAMQGDGRQG